MAKVPYLQIQTSPEVRIDTQKKKKLIITVHLTSDYQRPKLNSNLLHYSRTIILHPAFKCVLENTIH